MPAIVLCYFGVEALTGVLLVKCVSILYLYNKCFGKSLRLNQLTTTCTMLNSRNINVLKTG